MQAAKPPEMDVSVESEQNSSLSSKDEKLKASESERLSDNKSIEDVFNRG